MTKDQLATPSVAGQYSSTCIGCNRQMEWADKRCRICTDCDKQKSGRHGDQTSPGVRAPVASGSLPNTLADPRSSKKVSRPKLSDRLTDDDYLQRLKSNCIITESGCWEKQGFRSISKGMEHHGRERGYGHMYYRGRRWAAHRLSWLLTRGLIPAGSVVMHKCDNPPCCNPDHLELGTDKQNMQEAGKRKRWPRQYNPTCKHGHPRTPENVIYHGREKKMRCRICQLTKWRKAAGWPEHLLTIPKVPNGYSHEQVTRNAT